MRSCCSQQTDRLTSFKASLPVFAVEVCVDEAPEDVSPVRQRERVEKLWHGQRGQLAKLRLEHGPQAGTPDTRDKSQLNEQTQRGFHDQSSFLLFTAHTRGSASSPGCRLRTGGDLYERGIDTLHGDKGSSDSSSC